MRTFERIAFALILGAAPVATPGFAFDGSPVNQNSTIPVVSTPSGAAVTLKKGAASGIEGSASAYAAETVTQWKLGRM